MAAESEPERHYTAEELVRLWSEFMIEGARFGDVEDVKQALENSARVDAQDSSGRTALHMAAANGHVDIAVVLLGAGANTEVKSQEGSTALHWACTARAEGLIKLLLESGANPAAVNNVGQVPIDNCLDNESIMLLFQRYSDEEVKKNMTVSGNVEGNTVDDLEVGVEEMSLK